ncbi:hypothetical protein SKAU_G00419520 [Synaphobranchus kaupii]|uniref:G-protein coupled receptor family C group 6 member A n=1 Tax=Synaphobranchus kaupii TaxID=118154 RepID=A0A9Q1E6D8_SYNKA|nr:hypothetical protein SKAU_G00419520 [Synaphobranchus kaupii]
MSAEHPCSIPGGPRGVCQTGDVIVGGLFPLHRQVNDTDTSRGCAGFSPNSFIHTRVMIYSIGVINKSPMLPNLTLGYEMYDTCGNVSMAIKATLRLMDDRSNHGHECLSLSNEYTASARGAKVVVGEAHSEISIAVARLLALPLIPQISYGSTSELLSRKTKFPSFLRTVPGDSHQTKAMVRLMETLQWESVGLIGSEDEYGKYGVESLIDHMSITDVCLDFKEILPMNVFHNRYTDRLTSLLQTVNESTAEGIVIFTKTSNVRAILEEAIRLGVNRTWIAGDTWSTSSEIRSLKGIQTIGKVYGFIMKRNTVPGFEEHVRSFTAQPKMNDSFFDDYLNQYPACPSPTADITPNGQDPQNCSFHDADEGSATTNCTNIQCLTKHIDQDMSYSIYLAVNVVARALHRLLKCDYMKCNRSATFSGRELLEEIRRVNFTMDNITNIAFDQHGDPSIGYDILAWGTEDGTLEKIGEYRASGDIELPEHLKNSNVTVTVHNCSKACPRGQELNHDKNTCCKTCNFCVRNQYSRGGNETCRSCQEDEYVSPERDCCLKKAVAFLKWTDGFAVVLAAFGVAGLIFTLLVAALFIKHRGTPIVKGTGGNLCFLILVSLATSFGSLCAFIGKPTDLSCKVGLPLFIISFSLCVSCILANLFQIRVGFAFNARAHDRLMRFNNPVAIATGCVSIQAALVAAWLALAPPFRQEVSTYRAKVVVQCANGSDAMFGATLSYIAFLAVVCFLFAFKGKQLPDLYKNSSFITVGMLVYLVAWMLFIPIYVNTSGKYVQAVEASAMLVSNYSILCCHFCPKCYIILFRKELNNERVILDYIKKHYESKGVSPVTTDK